MKANLSHVQFFVLTYQESRPDATASDPEAKSDKNLKLFV